MIRQAHSIVLSDDNALIYRRIFRRAAKNRLPGPFEIRALDFKQEFRRSAVSSVSATIGIDWSIF
jgi:hypothetical protein